MTNFERAKTLVDAQKLNTNNIGGLITYNQKIDNYKKQLDASVKPGEVK